MLTPRSIDSDSLLDPIHWLCWLTDEQTTLLQTVQDEGVCCHNRKMEYMPFTDASTHMRDCPGGRDDCTQLCRASRHDDRAISDGIVAECMLRSGHYVTDAKFVPIPAEYDDSDQQRARGPASKSRYLQAYKHVVDQHLRRGFTSNADVEARTRRGGWKRNRRVYPATVPENDNDAPEIAEDSAEEVQETLTL
jgi:hypothetical protein